MDANFLINYNKILKILMIISLLNFLIVFLIIPYDHCRMCAIDYKDKEYNGIEIQNIWNAECGKLYVGNLLPKLVLQKQQEEKDRLINAMKNMSG